MKPSNPNVENTFRQGQLKQDLPLKPWGFGFTDLLGFLGVCGSFRFRLEGLEIFLSTAIYELPNLIM